MSEVTELLNAMGQGDAAASARLLPLVYDELRRLARLRMANERTDHTLQATALVHEAYLRLIGNTCPQWDGRGHFFAAAAEAMRRILVDHARGKDALKRGGQQNRVDIEGHPPFVVPGEHLDDLLALDEALTKLETEAIDKARLVKLRFFAGLTLEEAAQAMGISESTAKRYWTCARAWLYEAMEAEKRPNEIRTKTSEPYLC